MSIKHTIIELIKKGQPKAALERWIAYNEEKYGSAKKELLYINAK